MRISLAASQRLSLVGVAARIRAFRVRAGKSQSAVAKSLDLNIAWYADLETRDDEMAATLTIFKALELASIFGVPLHELLGEASFVDDRIALMDLPQRIKVHAARSGMSIEQLEKRLGWELREFLDSPVQVSAEMPIAFFQAIAAELGMNWLALVPDAD